MNDKSSQYSDLDSQVLLTQLAMEFLREKKRKRCRGWIGRILLLVLIMLGFYLYFSLGDSKAGSMTNPHVGLIDVKNAIFENESASAENFSKSMGRAYASQGLKALILRIDSPGGSPVQADYMYNTIKYYQKKHKEIKVYAVCVDICASAAYYVAAAADEIYANPSSMVGSIGVLYNGFGFVDILHKLGITRRLYTAGDYKGFMDQFSPVSPEQEKLFKDMLDIIHQEFIRKVKMGRGSRLMVDSQTFSGLFWTGVQAKQRGLIDGFASSGQLAREKIKIPHIVDYSFKESALERVAKHIGVAMVGELPRALGIKPGLH